MFGMIERTDVEIGQSRQADSFASQRRSTSGAKAPLGLPRPARTAAGQPARVLRGDLPGRGGGVSEATSMVAQCDERRLVR